MFRLILICLFSILCCANRVYSLYQGDYCELKSGEAGVCELFMYCQQAVSDLTKYGIQPTSCAFQETNPVVCCRHSRKKRSVYENLTSAKKVGYKARAKCEEYSRYVYKEMATLVRLLLLKHAKTDICANDHIANIHDNDVQVSSVEFPHMVRLGYGDKNKIIWRNSGSLISKEYVLTAAHCLRMDNEHVTYVLLGNTKYEDYLPQEIEVEKLIKHPNYANKYPNDDDIALIKLKEPAVLNAFVRPACLNTKDTLDVEKVLTTGWITDKKFDDDGFLLRESLDLIDSNECNKSYNGGKGVYIDEELICAGKLGRNYSENSCKVESGGLLQVYNDNPYCTFSIIGVTSNRRACSEDVPKLYTRITKYLDWIENIVWA